MKIELESGWLDNESETIKLDINNLKENTYDAISEAFEEVLLQAGLDPKKILWEEWTLTCKYVDYSKEPA